MVTSTPSTREKPIDTSELERRRQRANSLIAQGHAAANEGARYINQGIANGSERTINYGYSQHSLGRQLIDAGNSELRYATAALAKLKERAEQGFYLEYLQDLRPARPSSNPDYHPGDADAETMKGYEYFNPRTGDAINGADAWILQTNRLKKYPELRELGEPTEPLSKFSRKKYAKSLVKKAKDAQKIYDNIATYGLLDKAGASYSRFLPESSDDEIPEGKKWLTHDEEIEAILDYEDELEKQIEASKAKNPLNQREIDALIKKRDTEPVRFWWDNDPEIDEFKTKMRPHMEALTKLKASNPETSEEVQKLEEEARKQLNVDKLVLPRAATAIRPIAPLRPTHLTFYPTTNKITDYPFKRGKVLAKELKPYEKATPLRALQPFTKVWKNR